MGHLQRGREAWLPGWFPFQRSTIGEICLDKLGRGVRVRFGASCLLGGAGLSCFWLYCTTDYCTLDTSLHSKRLLVMNELWHRWWWWWSCVRNTTTWSHRMVNFHFLLSSLRNLSRFSDIRICFRHTHGFLSLAVAVGTYVGTMVVVVVVVVSKQAGLVKR
ncbi:hypothetical protein IWX92DRAFT_26121 [Phyllosticta citricarpa]